MVVTVRRGGARLLLAGVHGNAAEGLPLDVTSGLWLGHLKNKRDRQTHKERDGI
jgi:hypothetical protein